MSKTNKMNRKGLFSHILIATLLASVLAACASRSEIASRSGADPYLWRAAVEILSTLPLASTDAAGGVIITEWVNQKGAKGDPQRLKLTVAILTSTLRADGVRVAAFLQKREKGKWSNSAPNRNVERQIENLILTRARALRLGGSQNE